MEAIHIRTEGLEDEVSTALIEMTLSRIVGVARVVAVRPLHVTSVMYEERLVDWKALVTAIRSLGFQAWAIGPSAAWA